MNYKLLALICAGLLVAPLAAETEEKEIEKCEEIEQAEERMKNGLITFVTTHPGYEHHAMVVARMGDTVETEDGAVYAIRSSDQMKTLDWRVSDIIVITPNYSWFSNYDFSLVNTKTDAIVEAKFLKKPYATGQHAMWVDQIEYKENKICLRDGSLWNISMFDDYKLRKWKKNDTVIIGNNNSIFSTDAYPNILINLDSNPISYIPCRCYY